MVIDIRRKVEKYGYKMYRFIPNKLAILRKENIAIHISMIHGVKIKNKDSLTFDEIAMISLVIKELKK